MLLEHCGVFKPVGLQLKKAVFLVNAVFFACLWLKAVETWAYFLGPFYFEI